MTKENKELLLKDLSSRLLYGVILEHEGELSKLDAIFICDSISISSTSLDKKLSYNLNLDEFKPYLYPMSSMTDEQEEEYNKLNCYEGRFPRTEEALDYVIANYFDYRDLISLKLVKDATELDIYNLIRNRDKDIKRNSFDVLPGLYKCVHRMFDGTPDGRLLFEVNKVYKCLSKHNRAEFEVSYGHSIYLEDPVVCKHFTPFKIKDE